MFGLLLLFSLLQVPLAYAANAAQWRDRSIYQVIVDRFALPSGADLNSCDPGQQTWCGGTWKTLKDNLDYIQNQGFTAIWISPISQNYQGSRSAYGDPYHGYWIADNTKLNEKFGTEQDLVDLITEVHKRNMYIMVDVVVNNVMWNSLDNIDYSTFMFQHPEQYHTYCPVDYSNYTSEQICWLGDSKVPLPDLDTTRSDVIAQYQTWIQGVVQKYNIDGLRIDAAKHVNRDFWPGFCKAAGVFCIGEVFDGNSSFVGLFQGSSGLDSVLNYPTYGALGQAFTIPGPQNMSALLDTIQLTQGAFPDPTVLGNFIENQDTPRWANISVDPMSLHNVMTYNFMSDGIPIVYYGQEQGFHGNADPYNREALWTSNYAQSDGYQLTASLNQIRNWLINSSLVQDWSKSQMSVLTSDGSSMIFQKGPVVTVVTNIGSPPMPKSISAHTTFPSGTAMMEMLSCTQIPVGSNGTISMQYLVKGGVPLILIPTALVKHSGLCGTTFQGASDASSSATRSSRISFSAISMALAAGFLARFSNVL